MILSELARKQAFRTPTNPQAAHTPSTGSNKAFQTRQGYDPKYSQYIDVSIPRSPSAPPLGSNGGVIGTVGI